jgi:hypothetical protein
MAQKVIKAANSLKGWELKEWFKGNYRTIKELIKVGVPFWIGISASADPELAGLITLFGKLILDAFDYYLKEKTA